ncbi:MAG: hypothetical protein V3V22_06085 [Methylococcales bacterium]
MLNLQILKGVARGSGVENVECLKGEQDIVRSVQEVKGHKPCFQSDERDYCVEYDCEWRTECMKLVAAWMR